MSDTFDHFNVTCKQHHKNVLNQFLNGTKNGDIDGMCKRGLNVVQTTKSLNDYFIRVFPICQYCKI